MLPQTKESRRYTRPAWQDAYAAQMELWRWYDTTPGRRFLFAGLDDALGRLALESTRELIYDMYAAESGRLTDCDPIYVSGEMCELVEAAATSFALEPLLETDVITPRGFLYFEKPILIEDRFAEPTALAAASWTRIWASNDEAAILGFRESLEDYNSWDAMEQAGAEFLESTGLALTLYTTGDQGGYQRELEGFGALPRLLPLHITPWYFNMTYEGNELDETGQPTGAGWWWRVLQTSFRLMQQQLAHKRRERPDRPLRRESVRAGGRPETEVVVVRLRRESNEEAGEPTGEANYSHRFIVSGHWRNQWYPSERLHRQIWISPYVKGPEDKPLIVRPRRVFQWQR